MKKATTSGWRLAVLLFVTAAAGFALGALLTLSLTAKRKQKL